MNISRNQEHFIVMTVIYNELNDYLYGEEGTFRDARLLMSEVAEIPYEEISDYVKNTVILSLQKYGEIVKAFETHLKNWEWKTIHS